MGKVSYDKVYARFYSKVTAYDLGELVDETAYDLMLEWLESAYANPFFTNLFEKFVPDNDVGEIEFILFNSKGNEKIDENFVIEVLAYGVVKNWVEPKYFSTLATSQIFTGKEQKFYSQASHLAGIEGLYKNSEKQFNKLIKGYGYINNSYLTGGET